ncbi:MAG: DUF2029 domain-containing protein [Candidatus Marinimicrobia bacterium]|jgi:hypothetical protein|nr:DUF2029 domain-containing protein [Gammaproteobacteria bacterium]MBT5956118.1 DUF2029 domain-containing protein [Candidatus Neomarinimicrobiota bacterium]
MQRNTKLLWFMGVSSIVLIAMYLWTDIRWKQTSKAVELTNLTWESLDSAGNIQKPLHFIATENSGNKFFHINFSFKANSNEAYPNILQTSNVNSGVRLELGKPSAMAIIIGRAKDSFFVTQTLTQGEWHEISLDITPNHLRVVLDNVLMLDQTRDFNYKIDDIAIGSGFSKTRPFVGEIKVHSLSYGFMEKNRPVIQAFAAWILLTVSIFVVMLAGPAYRLSKLFFLKNFIARLVPMLSRPLDNQEKIVWTATIVGIGGMAWYIFYYVFSALHVHTYFSPTGLPMTIHYPANIFADFFRNFDLQSRMGLGSTSNYFPFSAIVFGFSGWLGRGSPYSAVAFSVGLGSTILIWLTWLHFRTSLKTAALLCAFVVSMMSYPMLFTLHTGNIEIWVFIFLCLFFVTYQAGKPVLSTVFLAASIAMKLYPAIFIILFVIDKRYRLVLYTLAWVVVLTLFPFLIWPIAPDLYLQSLSIGMSFYKDVMIESYSGVYFGHSIVNFLRALWPNLQPASLYPAYYVFAGITLILMTIYATFMEKVLWKKIAVLVIALCLLPPTSTEYKLLYFFIPFFFFVNHNVRSKTDSLYVLLFSFLFINKGYMYFHGDQFVTLNGVANTAIMVVMLILILLEHFMSSWQKAPSNRKVLA